MGSVLDERPEFDSEEDDIDRQSMLSGYTGGVLDYFDISYSEDDWNDEIRI